jgi:hypothetical protein
MDMIRSAEGPKVAGVFQSQLRARWDTANTILDFLRVRATYIPPQQARCKSTAPTTSLLHKRCMIALTFAFHNEWAHVYLEAAKDLPRESRFAKRVTMRMRSRNGLLYRLSTSVCQDRSKPAAKSTLIAFRETKRQSAVSVS